MTAETFSFSSMGSFLSLPTAEQFAIVSENDEQQPVATLGRESIYEDRVEVVRRVLDVALRSPYVQPRALVHLVNWLGNLPTGVPKPFIAVGDDGSVSSEWDVRGSSLHVTFYDDEDEVYFTTPNGDEWEATTEAVDKVSSAVRAITLRARG